MASPTKYQSIERITTRTSLWAAALTLFVVFAISWVSMLEEKHSEVRSEQRRLGSILNPIARSLSAEILVGDIRSVQTLKAEMKRRYDLANIETTPVVPRAETTQWYSFFLPSASAMAFDKLPAVQPDQYVVIYASAKPSDYFTGFNILVLVGVPLVLFGVFITWRNRRELHRSIVKPIQALAKDPEHWEAEGSWVAQEAITLHERLLSYIQERDAERDRSEKLKVEASVGQIAAQVAHDIRSPLAALDMISGSLSQLPEEKRVILRSALSRIRDIANGLLEKHRGPKPKQPQFGNCPIPGAFPYGITRCELLSGLVDSLVTEKRMQYRTLWGIEIEAPLTTRSYGLFAEVDGAEFQRLLSNLVNNSVEALGSKGRITIEMDSNYDTIFIRVRDNGKGIAPEIIPRLTEKGSTFGKVGGAGLGLYHAKKQVETWKGKLRIFSRVGTGTAVEIELPRSEAPSWFVSQIELSQDSHVVVLDDDTSIHQIWRGRFDSLRLREKNVSVWHFATTHELREWRQKTDTESEIHDAFYLVDYELIGSDMTGLELIQRLGIEKRSVLVTSRFEERAIREACERLRVRVIPKSLAGFVPISVEGEAMTGVSEPSLAF